MTLCIFLIPTVESAKASVNRLGLPLHFEPNRGQAAEEIAYFARNDFMSVILGFDGSARLELGPNGQSLLLRPVGGQVPSRIEARELAPGVSNYFLMLEPEKWSAAVPRYRRVRLHDVWPGVDIEFYGRDSNFEYDFIAQPGIPIPELRIELTGAKTLSIDNDGDLIVATESGLLKQRMPVAFQPDGDRRHAVDCHYELRGDREVVISLGPRRDDLPLVVDPVLDYSTYLGGPGEETLNALAVDDAGNVYVAGITNSVPLPVAGNPVQPAAGGGRDVFIAKLAPDGATVLYATYLGGSGDDRANAIALDSGGNVYIAGYGTTGFPVTAGAYRTKCCGAFAAKLNPSGDQLLYSTFLGSGEPYGIAVDGTGHLFLAGSAYESYPTTPGAVQTGFGGGIDAFVTKLDPTGSALVYSTFLGGSNYDRAYALGINDAGDAFISGYAHSPNFPVTAGAFRTIHAGDADAFAARVSADGRTLVYSTLLGGSSRDEAHAIAVASNNRAYLAGITFSSNFPVSSGAYRTPAASGSANGFAAAVEPAGNAVLYSTSLGTVKDYYVTRFGAAIDNLGSLFVTGAAAIGFPTTADALHRQPAGGTDAFVIQLNAAGTSAEFATYLGGSGEDYGRALAVDGTGRILVAGYTSSINYPADAGAAQASSAGATDSFVARIDRIAAPCNVSLAPSEQTLPRTAAQGSFSVSATSGCPWTTNSSASWVSIVSGASGVGSGIVTYSVAASTSPGYRTATITIDDRTFTVHQMGTQDPTTPNGATGVIVGRTYAYASSGPVYPSGAVAQYRFDWGDGRLSGWGGASQQSQWSAPGVYFVRAQARSSTNTSLQTGWSAPLVVNAYHPAGVLTDDTFVTQIYRDILNREPDQVGRTAALTALSTGTLTRTEITANLVTGSEFRSYGGYVIRCYLGVMRRSPDFGGWLYWYNHMRAGFSQEKIAEQFVKAKEFVNLYGSLTNEEFVTLLYSNILGRAPDPSGFAYWLGHLNSGTLTRAGVVSRFIASPEYTQKSETRVRAETLHLGLWRRTGTSAEISNWLEFLNTHSLPQAMEYFLTSPQYLDRFK